MKKAAVRKLKIALLVIVAILICDIPSITYATTTEQKLEEALQEHNKISQELEEQADQKEELEEKESSLKSELSSLNEQLTTISNHLEELEIKIRDKEAQIESTQALLDEARATEEWQYECLVQRIQFMYEAGETEYLDLIFSAGSFSEFVNYSDYFNAVVEYDQKMLKEYETTRETIETEEARLVTEKLELDALKVEAEAEKSRVAGLVSQTSSNIAKYSNDIEAMEREIEAKEALLKEQEKDIDALRKQIAAEKALSAAAANAAWRDISEVTFADGDRRLLANIIYCEAGGEPYEGQLAVGAVVINRVLSSRYPDTVVGVIYQNKQFSPVGSGRLELALALNKATASCYRAADEAMSGMTNVGNCLYFRTPIEGLTGTQIGGHIFY